MSAHPTSVDEVNFFDPATQENWYPSYDLLREEAHVWQMPGTNTYVLTRYEDIQDVLRRTDVFMRGASESTPSAGASAVVKESTQRRVGRGRACSAATHRHTRSTATSPTRSSRLRVRKDVAV